MLCVLDLIHTSFVKDDIANKWHILTTSQTSVVAHVDELVSRLCRVQSAPYDRLRVSDEGVDGSVGGRSCVHVKKSASRRRRYAPGYFQDSL